MQKMILCVVGALAMMLPSGASAQCGCDFVISTSATEWQFDGAKKGVKPGDKICFASGTRTGINIINVHGTASNPVTITNMCDGKVTINAPSSYGNSVEIDACSYIHFTGSGNPNEEYGIEIKGAIMGINFQGLTTNFEADHLNINSVGCVGLVAKTDPTCDASTWRGNFTLRNAIIHDNTISNTGCEGMYIGNSHYDTTVPKTCNGTSLNIQEHLVDGCQVYNNTLKNIGNDGIQIGGSINTVVHDNYLYNIATNRSYGHQNGFQMGGGTQATVYNNVMDTGTGYCYYDSGGGGVYYNNVGINCEQAGMLLEDTKGSWAPKGFIVTNNNFVNCKDIGILMFSENTATSYFINNIFVGPNQSNYSYIHLNNPGATHYVESNNIKTQDINSVKFSNAAGKDYHLQSGSSAVDVGTDARSYGVTFDMDRNARPQGAGFDIGAYEYKSSTTNAPPVANAGSDKTITLPTSSVSFSGSGTDSDGTISKYAWTKVSGGTAVLSNTSSATLSVSSLIAGSYVFRLTVTDNKGATDTDDVNLTVNSATNAAPVANAGSDKTITLPTTSVSFSGSGTDSDGTISKYAWTKVSGGTAVLSNTSSATLSVNSLVAGSYTFRLTVTDNKGATGSDDVKLTVASSGTNIPPVANAGPDKSISLPTNSVTFNGSGTDADGSITKYSWIKVSGEGGTLVNASTPNLTVNNLNFGTYKFRIYVTDNANATTYDDVILVVQMGSATNLPPAANAGPDKTVTVSTSSASFAGTGSDPDGTIQSYSWSQVSGGVLSMTNANSSTLQVSGLTVGTHVFRLTVTDNAGASASDDVTLTVTGSGVNVPPAANAGADADITLPTNSYTFHGQGTDVDGYITKYSWIKVSGEGSTLVNANTANLTVNNLNFGTYKFRIYVTDNSNATTYDDVILVVKMGSGTANTAPTANAGPDKAITLSTSSVSFVGTGSDPDGTIQSYSWSEVSGGVLPITFANSSTLQVSGFSVGTYVFRLTVTDNAGASATDDVTLTVTGSGVNVPPVANAGADADISLPTNSYTFHGQGTDVDGYITQYSWIKVSGEGSTLVNANTANLTVNNLNFGTYKFRIYVTDNSNATTYDDVVIVVRQGSSSARISATDGAIDEVKDANNAFVGDKPSDTDNEENFVFMDKTYFGTHNYEVVIFDGNGGRIFSGKWDPALYYDIFKRSGLYIYHVLRDGMQFDSGKVYITN